MAASESQVVLETHARQEVVDLSHNYNVQHDRSVMFDKYDRILESLEDASSAQRKKSKRAKSLI